MGDKVEKKRLAILKILLEDRCPHGSQELAARLLASGHDLSERTVRFHLQALDAVGLTENLGKQGRRITERGARELSNARVFEKVGYLAAKIDQLTYTMDFDLSRREGTVVVNVSLLEREQIAEAIPKMARVFAAKLGVGRLAALFGPGERVGDVAVPEGKVGVGTVCSITFNGVLLRHGIPVTSRFGGLLELRALKPTRFVELIHYEGTTLDPLEVFIRSGMTDYKGAVETGDGLVGASFREIPGNARDRVLGIARGMVDAGLGVVIEVGWPGRPLFDIPVSEGRLGVVVMGGLNPVAILEETGMRVRQTGALAGLVDFRRLIPYDRLAERAARL
jgi:HTH-type transcriptional regulator, global nitrogen regulator NrpRI